jgi:hypothetical protein
MSFISINTFLWIGLALLAVGSIYLIIEGYKVHKLFNESIVGRLVKILVVVLLIELYSLGIVCFAFLTLYPKGSQILLPIVVLWLISLAFAVAGVKSAKKQVTGLINPGAKF